MNLAFAAPWVLAGLALLPVLWWLLRVTPPSPRRRVFPPLRILRRAAVQEETAARTPPWLLVLRMLIAAALIAAAAGPVLNRAPTLAGAGPLILVVDNGWAAGRDWPARRAAMADWIERAERQDRAVALLTTADDAPVELIEPEAAARRAEAIRPHPWPTDRTAALARLRDALPSGTPPGSVIWLADGLGNGRASADFAKTLGLYGTLRVFDSGPDPLLLRPAEAITEGLSMTAERPAPGPATRYAVRAYDQDGQPLDRFALTFADGALRAEAKFDPPSEIRNRIARLAVEGVSTAGATTLLDEGARRRPVGLIAGPSGSESTPLLNAFHYLTRALGPFAEVRRGTVEELLARETAVLVLPDAAALSAEAARKVGEWIAQGGTLIRFAGPHLARAEDDGLLPVTLRRGERSLGGALSWNRPAALAPFEATSPFHGLAIPDDVRIKTQVLAQPSPQLDGRSWARLQDGTPLVTANSRGRGRIVLFHVGATPEWSNLPMSGLFVGMLQRLSTMAHGVARTGSAPLPPLSVLDGLGRLGTPPASVLALPPDADPARVLGPDHPPGFYGTEGGLRAFNLAPAVGVLRPLPDSLVTEAYGASPRHDLAPWLLVLALTLLIVDLAVSLGLRGLLRFGGATAAALLIVVTARADEPIDALSGDAFAIAASGHTRLAYVVSGDSQIDATSRAGLNGLSQVVARRTAAELAEPVGIDIEKDPVVFFPILYWPLTDAAPPSAEAAAKVRDYLAGGGVILFDSRDPQGVVSGHALRALAQALDVPPLEPAPEDHVLRRSFYLLRDFPGRWAGGTVWVEQPGGRVNDGVSSVIAGANDWAAAWAVDAERRPLFPVVPGGERQRETAYRFGVNLVMYALTGNYKGDQVHLPAILKRLGL